MPDKDGDGVEDKNDQCPTVKGTVNGCPDADSDGVADKDDKCKDAAGVARYSGCPVPDADKDGINDEEDKCKDKSGDVILKKSNKALDEVVKILQDNPELKLNIEAHADNRGTPERNMMWSERRAKAVAVYFILKGIAPNRISYKGNRKRKGKEPESRNESELLII